LNISCLSKRKKGKKGVKGRLRCVMLLNSQTSERRGKKRGREKVFVKSFGPSVFPTGKRERGRGKKKKQQNGGGDNILYVHGSDREREGGGRKRCRINIASPPDRKGRGGSDRKRSSIIL